MINSNSDPHFMNTIGGLENYKDLSKLRPSNDKYIRSSKMSNHSGKIPINAVRNHKSSLAKYSNYTKQLYKSIDLIENNRSRSSKRPVKIRGIKYRF